MPGIPLQWIHGHPNFLGSNQQQGRNFNLVAVKHERGTRGAAPASNAARRSNARGTPLPTCSAVSCHVAFVFSSRLAPTRLRLGPIRTESSCIGRNRRFRPKFKKKKKRCKTHRLNKILNPPSAHFTQTHQIQLSASHSLCHSLVSHSLCALCLCLYSL